MTDNKTPAPAMPNGVDSVAYLLDELRFSRRGYFTSQRRGELADKLEAAIAADFDRLRAADNRDAAGVDGAEGWPPCPECKAGILYECPACSSTNYPRDAIAPQEGEDVGEVVAFGSADLKEVAWRKGKMPPTGTKLYAHPSACELGAVQRLAAKFRAWASSASAFPRARTAYIDCAEAVEALQHRGDSRGGEG